MAGQFHYITSSRTRAPDGRAAEGAAGAEQAIPPASRPGPSPEPVPQRGGTEAEGASLRRMGELEGQERGPRRAHPRVLDGRRGDDGAEELPLAPAIGR